MKNKYINTRKMRRRILYRKTQGGHGLGNWV